MSTQIAVIIPTLNEEQSLGALLSDLARQVGVELEVCIADGGSQDGTRQIVEDFAPGSPFPVKWIDAPRGRGAQLNAGAGATGAPDLLFIHADSRLPEAGMVAHGRDAMARRRKDLGHDRVAGHYGVRFEGRNKRPGFFYFWEAKSHTNRRHSINGDQGNYLSREFFELLGGFDQSLPFMEDARLALRVAALGEWTALPGAILTSSRRFEVEGYGERQTLNSLIRNFDYIGLTSFMRRAGEIYKVQSRAGKLRLRPFLALAHRLSLRRGAAGWLSWWYATGGFVRDNAWHLAFALDCRRNRKRGVEPDRGDFQFTMWFDKWFNLLFNNCAGKTFTMVVTMAAFFSYWAYLAMTDAPARSREVEAPAPEKSTKAKNPFLGTDAYHSGKLRPGLLARLFASAYFYVRAFIIVYASSRKAKAGAYDDAAWVGASLAFVRLFEDVGTEFHVEGLDELEKLDGPAVIVANHMSTMETFVFPSILNPRSRFTFVVKQSLMDYPIFGHVMRSRRPIAVGRASPREDLMLVMKEGKRLLNEGLSVLIFPQTTRTDQFDPAKFNTIGAKLAARSGVPLVPVALQTGAWGPGKRLKDFGKIRPELPARFRFGAPIPTEGKGDEAHRQSVEFIKKAFEEWEG